MSSTVNILCPNGRRVNVKVSPNTTLLQVLEEASMKQDYSANEHDLKHGRTILDLTATFRFSGVPNNGKLELVKSAKPRSQSTEVVIALQLEIGERRQMPVSTDSTLLDMIKLFQKEGEELSCTRSIEGSFLHPVIINMREEIIGVEALEHYTLKSIGIINGKTALRLIHRSVDPAVLENINQKIEKEKRVIAKYVQKRDGEKKAIELQKDCSQSSTSSSDVNPQIQTAQPSNSDAMDTAEEGEQESIEADPASLSSQTGNISAAVGVNPFPLSSANTDVEMKSPSVHQVRPKLPPNNTVAVTPFQPFANFKFPEETAGQKLYQNELSEYAKEEYFPCEREAIVFNMTEDSSYAQTKAHTDVHSDLPEDFFEVTKNDLQVMLRDIRNQISTDDNAPLMTSSMRQAKLEASVAKYKKAVIRFHFPDKYVLQANFNTMETVFSLRKFVKTHLQSPDEIFTLYTTPPKKVLSDLSNTLVIANLVPMSVVYVGVDAKKAQYVSDEVISQKRTKLEADIAAQKCLPPADQQCSSSVIVPSASSSGATISHQHQSTSRCMQGTAGGGGVTGAKVPKWYKPSK